MAARQMAELNTNTRFINDRMITFAEKLTSSLPDPLSKCIFVNSRSVGQGFYNFGGVLYRVDVMSGL